jgi:lipid A 3-O-deacylase
VIKSMQRVGWMTAWALVLMVFTGFAAGQAVVSNDASPFHVTSGHLPLEMGVLVQGGFGLTQNRGSFKFLLAGVHAGKVLTENYLSGPLRGNLEYAVEVFPFWQSYTPKFQRESCVAIADPGFPNGVETSCSAPYTVGGTFRGVSVTPIILRWNFLGTRRVSPWVQGAGGVIWTNHKYPAFGGPPYNLVNDGPNSDASVWNFTPQGGVGVHYFLRPRRSIDFGANAVHISSASLGDKNPGVNASVQFSLGYTWWK